MCEAPTMDSSFMNRLRAVAWRSMPDCSGWDARWGTRSLEKQQDGWRSPQLPHAEHAARAGRASGEPLACGG